MGTILTVYIPTLLLIIISHMTNYFKPFFFEAVVTVNLTVMLVLATMFISVSDNLPKTSYIKMVDVWLIFNLMIPFFEVKNIRDGRPVPRGRGGSPPRPALWGGGGGSPPRPAP